MSWWDDFSNEYLPDFSWGGDEDPDQDELEQIKALNKATLSPVGTDDKLRGFFSDLYHDPGQAYERGKDLFLGSIPELQRVGEDASEYINPSEGDPGQPLSLLENLAYSPLMALPGVPKDPASLRGFAGEAVKTASELLSPIDVLTAGAGGAAKSTLKTLPRTGQALYDAAKALDLASSTVAAGAGAGEVAEGLMGGDVKQIGSGLFTGLLGGLGLSDYTPKGTPDISFEKRFEMDPIKAYHGTGDLSFVKPGPGAGFDMSKMSQDSLRGPLPYFTDNPRLASEYALLKNEGVNPGNIEVELSPGIPFDLSDFAEPALKREALERAAGLESEAAKAAFQDISTNEDLYAALVDSGVMNKEGVISWLGDKGYGSILEEGGRQFYGAEPHQVFTPFDTSQINPVSVADFEAGSRFDVEDPTQISLFEGLKRKLIGEDVPSQQRGAVGDSSDLNKFEDSQARKYGPGWREKQSDAEKAFHVKLMSGEGSFLKAEQSRAEPEVNLEDPASVEKDLIKSGLMSPEELGVEVPTKSLFSEGKVNESALQQMIEDSKKKPEELPLLEDPDAIALDATKSIKIEPEIRLPKKDVGADVTDTIEVFDPEKAAQIRDEDIFIEPLRKEKKPKEDIEVIDLDEEGVDPKLARELQEQIRLGNKLESAQGFEYKQLQSLMDKQEQEAARRQLAIDKSIKRHGIKQDQQMVREIDKISKAQDAEEIKKQAEEIKKQKAASAVPKETGTNWLKEAAGFFKTLRTSFDVSFGGRQGWAFLTRPEAWKGLKEGTGSFKEANHLQVKERLENSPNKPIYDQMGLDLADLDAKDYMHREESIPSKAISKLPGIKQSSRIYTDQANLVRANMADTLIDKWQKLGHTPESNPELYKATGKYINTLTMRAPIPEKMLGVPLRKAAEVLNLVYFGPRGVLSRIQTFTSLPFEMPVELKKEYIRDVGSMTAVTTALMTGAAAALQSQGIDASVETDPMHTDFGKLRVNKDKGGMSFDLLAPGTVNLIRTASRLATGEMRTRNGKYNLGGGSIKEMLGAKDTSLPRAKFGRGITDELLSANESKTAPIISAPISLLRGRGFVGEKYGPAEAVRDLIAPMSPTEIVEAYWNGGLSEALAASLGLFGPGVQVDMPEEKKGNFWEDESEGNSKKKKKKLYF